MRPLVHARWVAGPMEVSLPFLSNIALLFERDLV